jgi:metal transporter CNNM
VDSISLALQVSILVLGSGICSGLNVSIMSLNVADLERQATLGDKKARAVLPFRRKTHLTLAAILLTNVAFASASSIVLAGQLNGFVAAAISTLLLVFFGELLPQALFTKNALSFCYFFAPLLRLMTIVTYVIAKPLQLILDRWFGDEKRRLHSRHELSLIIGEHIKHDESELDDDEVEIIRGALQLSEKKVQTIMTPIEKTYYFYPATIIDAQKIDEIKQRGFSRIPIIDARREKCSGVILMKDLVDIDFAKQPRAIEEVKIHNAIGVGANTALDTMFRHFIGAHGHMMMVEKKNKIVGIVTIEDLIEEILGHEIEDETIHR